MSTFTDKLNGTLYGVLRWEDWDNLLSLLKSDRRKEWYLSAAGCEPPVSTLPPPALGIFLDEVNALLRNDHIEDYLGIVYADSLESPTLIKIYDPNNLGSACGSAGYKVQPGWVLSLDAPTSSIEAAGILPGGRRRWWLGLQERLLA